MHEKPLYENKTRLLLSDFSLQKRAKKSKSKLPVIEKYGRIGRGFCTRSMARRKTLRQKSAALRSRARRRRVDLPKLEVNERQSQEIWAILFGVLTVLSVFALSQALGIFGEVFVTGLFIAFGLGAYAMPVVFGALSLSFFFAKRVRMNFTRVVGIFLLLLGGLGVIHTTQIAYERTFVALQMGGGFFGAAASSIPRYYLGDLGTIVILTGVALIGVILTFPVSISAFVEYVLRVFGELAPTPSPKHRRKPESKKSEELTIVSPESRRDAEAALRKRQEFIRKQAEKDDERPLVARVGEWEFPTLDLLSSEKSEFFADEKLLQKKAENIRQKLAEFGIGCELGPVHVGPTVTQFTLRPDEGVKLSKITTLKNDLTLALATDSLRLEAPIPGKDLVGIEIPNDKRTTVHLREVLESSEFAKFKSSLRLALGRDVAGNAIIADLGDMPHLLIAGATGSGKSVGMNTFLVSLLYQNSPDDLKLILVDPKRVELAAFNGLPHLLTPVITDADKALAALRWCVAEMMRRYGDMSKKGYKNISEFNEKEEEKMPKIVIVIDELADLMMRQFKKDTEAAICRLAQMARAVGMHLIVATQRPSVDVITGLIKANMPTRIAFAVTSAVDSRTILDAIGAEDLLGKGDMLFSNSSLARPRRIQGIFVSSEEINRVTNRIKLQGQPEYDDSIIAGEEDAGGFFEFEGGGGSDGNVNEQAIEVIRQTGKASASLLQRRLSIGYARAARILDELEEQGMIGPARGAKPREIYL